MPLHEYRCRGCSHRFELLVRSGDAPACPMCTGRELERQLSVFAVGAARTASASPVAGPCGTCGDPRGPGSCALGSGGGHE